MHGVRSVMFEIVTVSVFREAEHFTATSRYKKDAVVKHSGSPQNSALTVIV